MCSIILLSIPLFSSIISSILLNSSMFLSSFGTMRSWLCLERREVRRELLEVTDDTDSKESARERLTGGVDTCGPGVDGAGPEKLPRGELGRVGVGCERACLLAGKEFL